MAVKYLRKRFRRAATKTMPSAPKNDTRKPARKPDKKFQSPEPGQDNFQTRNPARKILKPGTLPGTREGHLWGLIVAPVIIFGLFLKWTKLRLTVQTVF